MAGKVTGLRYQKRNADRVNVYLDGKFAFGLPATEAARLRPGQYLSDADVARLQTIDTFQKTYDRAVRFLSYRPRSKAEVRQNLAEAGIDEEVIQGVIERLIQHGYLNDEEFARFWVENRERFRPRGSRALRQELRQKGIDEKTAAAALAELDPEDSAYRAAESQARRLADLANSDARSFRQKLSGYLMRRGFDYEVVRAVVNRFLQELAAGNDGADEEL